MQHMLKNSSIKSKILSWVIKSLELYFRDFLKKESPKIGDSFNIDTQNVTFSPQTGRDKHLDSGKAYTLVVCLDTVSQTQ